MKTQRFLPVLLVAAMLSALSLGLFNARANDEFQPMGFTLKDRAVLLNCDEGTRRVRIQVRKQESGTWETVSIAHIDGRGGYLKMRLPDDVTWDKIRCESSTTDPFPASFYEGATSFSESADQSNDNGGGITNGLFAADADGALRESAEVTVEESDIWKWRDRTLYFFNALRGLQVFDLSDLNNPTKIASLRLPAVGEQMYLAGDSHVVLLSNDWKSWWRNDGGSKSEVVLVRHEGEELAVEEKFPVDGSFVESRMVGTWLYAVTRIWEQYQDEEDRWLTRSGLKVYRFDLSDPSNPVAEDPLDLVSSDGTGYFYNSVVTATPDYVFVTPNVYDSSASSYFSDVHVIDITDPGEPMTVSATIRLTGHLDDKFKLREADGILTTITQIWGSGRIRRTRVQTYNLEADGPAPALLDTLELAPNETVRATRFDGDRLYVVTFRMIDPLFMIDITDATNLKMLAELEVPGWSEYLEPRGDWLLGIGVDDRRVAVSTYDVETDESLALIERVHLGEEGQYSWSEANYNEKAVGYFPDEELLVLPFSGYVDGAYRTQMQIIDVNREAMSKRGVIDAEFNGRRSKLFDDKLVVISGRELQVVDIANRDQPAIMAKKSIAWPVERVIATGESLVQVEGGYNYWWNDSSEPATVRVTPQNDVDSVIAELSVGKGRVAGAVERDGVLYLATTRTDAYEVEIEDDPDGATRWVYDLMFVTDVVDLRDPAAPVKLGSVETVLGDGRYYYSGQYQGQFLPGGELLWSPDEVQNNYFFWGCLACDIGVARGGLVADVAVDGDALWWPWFYNPSGRHIVVNDVSDPAQPSVVSQLELPTTGGVDAEEVDDVSPNWYTELGNVFVNGDKVRYGYRRSNWIAQRYLNKHFVQEVDLSNPAEPVLPEPVNVPGLLEHIYTNGSGGTVIFTSRQKIEYDDTNGNRIWSQDQILEASVFDGLNAFLIDMIEVENGQYTPLAGHDQFLVKSKDPDWWWRDEEIEQGLRIYEWDESAGTFASLPGIDMDRSPTSLREQDGLLFGFGSGITDVVAIDQLPEPPAVKSFDIASTSYSYGSQGVDLSDDRSTAWLAVGAYGVETLDVSSLVGPPPVLAQGEKSKDWTLIAVCATQIVSASADDFVGPIPVGYMWRFQPDVDPYNFAAWVAAYFNPDNDPGIPLPLASEDTDGDGLANIVEFVLGTAPDDAGSVARPRVSAMRSDDGKEWLAISYTPNPYASGVEIVAEVSTDLAVNWRALAESEFDVLEGEPVITVKLSKPITADSEPRKYLRLRTLLGPPG